MLTPSNHRRRSFGQSSATFEPTVNRSPVSGDCEYRSWPENIPDHHFMRSLRSYKLSSFQFLWQYNVKSQERIRLSIRARLCAGRSVSVHLVIDVPSCTMSADRRKRSTHTALIESRTCQAHFQCTKFRSQKGNHLILVLSYVVARNFLILLRLHEGQTTIKELIPVCRLVLAFMFVTISFSIIISTNSN